MQRRRDPPTPVAQKVLSAVKRLIETGVVPTQARVVKLLEMPNKNSAAVALDRLQRDGWIKRPKHRPGLARGISLK